jgi:hypothetical protein
MTSSQTKLAAWAATVFAIAMFGLLMWLMTNVKPDQAARAAEVDKQCAARPADCATAAKLRDEITPVL